MLGCIFLDDTLADEKTPARVIGVGNLKNTGAALRIYNDESIDQKIIVREPNEIKLNKRTECLSFNSVSKIITPRNKLKNYIAATNQGMLYVLDNDFIDSFSRKLARQHLHSVNAQP